MENFKELARETEKKPSEEHGLDVGDELGLADQPVQPCALLQALQQSLNA